MQHIVAQTDDGPLVAFGRVAEKARWAQGRAPPGVRSVRWLMILSALSSVPQLSGQNYSPCWPSEFDCADMLSQLARMHRSPSTPSPT